MTAARACPIAAVAMCAACVVTEERAPHSTMPSLAPVVVPIAGATPAAEEPRDLYYRSVVTQMQAALGARDRPRLRELLDGHARPDAPDWAQQAMARFALAERGLQFQDAVAAGGRFACVDPASGVELAGPPPLGEALTMRFCAGPFPTAGVTLPAADSGDGGVAFVLRLQSTEVDAFGDELSHSSAVRIDLPADLDLTREPLELTFTVPPARAGVLRRVRVALTMAPGRVELDGAAVPLAQADCGATERTQVPAGIEPLQQRPLLTLENALRLGDPAHFAHVYLAAMHLPPADVEAGLAALIEALRLGRPGQAESARAALAVLAPDAARRNATREDWLRWWTERPRAGAEGR